MFCKYPQVFNKKYNVPMACGRCMPCRVKDHKVWTHRIILEAELQPDNCFLTLTYSDEHLPKEFHNKKTGQIYADNSVNPYHHELFIKSLREVYSRRYNKTFRFFGVGEYGDKTQRPHYHYALFGFPACTRVYKRGQRFDQCKCLSCNLVLEAWKKGNIFNGQLNKDSAAYVAQYVTKKMTSDNSEYQSNYLQGRYPEFKRQSLKPGLAFNYISEVATQLTNANIHEYNLLPRHLQHGTKKMPLGRYLSDKLYYGI